MTSIEWLKDYMQKMQYFIGNDLLEAFEEAKEMHKQEIIDAAERWKGTDFAERYYQETFVSKGSNETPMERKLLKSGFVDIVPKQETLYTEEQVRKAYYQGATDVHDKCTDRTWRGVETKVDIELLKKLNAEYIQSLK